MSVEIDVEVRDALRREALVRIGGADDIPVALREGAGAQARRLREQLAADTRLLDDLGWDAERRPSYVLTMADAELSSLMIAYLRAADETLIEGVDSFPPDERAELIDEALELRFAAARVLEVLDAASSGCRRRETSDPGP